MMKIYNLNIEMTIRYCRCFAYNNKFHIYGEKQRFNGFHCVEYEIDYQNKK